MGCADWVTKFNYIKAPKIVWINIEKRAAEKGLDKDEYLMRLLIKTFANDVPAEEAAVVDESKTEET